MKHVATTQVVREIRQHFVKKKRQYCALKECARQALGVLVLDDCDSVGEDSTTFKQKDAECVRGAGPNQ